MPNGRKLRHPVAEALRRKANELAVNIPPCDEALYRIGLGVEGQVNGYYRHVGNERFMRHSDRGCATQVNPRARRHQTTPAVSLRIEIC